MNPKCDADGVGGACQQPAMDNATRCIAHGGLMQARAHRTRRLYAAADEELLSSVMARQGLMDPRKPVALSQHLLDRTPLEASDDEAVSRARTVKLRALGPNLVAKWREQIEALEGESASATDVEMMLRALDRLIEPTEGDMDAAIREIHTESMKLVSLHAQRQVDAVKALEWSKAIHGVMIPFLGELGLQLASVVRRYVTDERQQKRALEDVAKVTQQVLGMISEVSRKQDPVPTANR